MQNLLQVRGGMQRLYLNKLKEFLSVITALSMDTLENSSRNVRNVSMQTVYVNSTVYVKINLEAIDYRRRNSRAVVLWTSYGK